LLNLAHKYALGSKLEFSGRVDSAEFLSGVDILVAPSLVPESFGRVIVEAQLSGACVVASNIGGPAQIIENQATGILVPPFDSKAIAGAVEFLIKNKEKSIDIAKKAYIKAKTKYTLKRMCQRTLEVYEHALKKDNIALIKITALGDVILSFYAFYALRRHFPSAHITFITKDAFAGIVRLFCNPDDMVLVSSPENKYKEAVRIGRVLRRRYIDISVDLQNNKISHLIAFIGLARRRIGYARKWGFLLTHKIKFGRQESLLGPIASQAKVLQALGIKEIPLPGLRIRESAMRFPAEFRQWRVGKKPLAGISIGASSDWHTKDLSCKKIAVLCSFLVARNYQVVLLGDKYLKKRGDEILSIFPDENVLNLSGKTSLVELASIIAKCNLFLSSDNACFHMAAILKINTIVFFGPTDPKRHSLNFKNIRVVRRNDLDCLSCYRKKCLNLRCMDISLDGIKNHIMEFESESVNSSKAS